MNRYIKRDDAIENIDELYFSDKDDHDRTREAIKRLSAADVVEVVRCKDCEYIKEEHFNIMPDGFSCELSGLMVESEHYCSYGERAEA